MRRNLPVGGLLLVGLAACVDSPHDLIEPAPERNWARIEPTQCGGSPWEQAGLSLDAYLAGLRIEVHGVTSEQLAEVVCYSCSCPTGERVCVLLDEPDVPLMEDEGFSRDLEGACPAD